MFETIVVGRLGRDAEMRYTPSGKAVTSFSVACDVGTKANPKTVWARVTLWDKQAEALTPYLLKGQSVVVIGDVTDEPRVWQGKDGEHRAAWEITGRRIKFTGSKPAEQQAASDGDVEYTDADIPF